MSKSKIAPAAPAVDVTEPATKKAPRKRKGAPATPTPAPVEVAPPATTEAAPPAPPVEAETAPPPFVLALAEALQTEEPEPAPVVVEKPTKKATSSKGAPKAKQAFVGLKEVAPAAADPYQHLRAINARRNLDAAATKIVKALAWASAQGIVEVNAALQAVQVARAAVAAHGKGSKGSKVAA